MRKFTKILMVGLALFLGQIAIQAQTTGSIAGTVVDQTGAVVAGATVTVKGEAGQNYTATTSGAGSYNIPGVSSGMYTVTVTAPNFKTSVIKNVKVDVATPATVNADLQAGKIEEMVVVTSGAEVLQTETAAVGTTIRGRQITETPIQSRDALDLVTLLPGTATLGVVRTSSINGLPKSALTISIDGVDVQDNFLKSSDGFFTFVRPRVDAIDEVTVSSATPGSESSGDGAVSIKFITRRGTNDYNGSGFWQHRDEGPNANNWLNNSTGLAKGKLRLNQFGVRFGGPIPFLGFGENVKAFDSGKDKRFFFFNYERFHNNESSPPRTSSLLNAEAQGGLFRYGANGASTVNLLALALGSDCDPITAGLQPCPSTVDPQVNNLLNLVRGTTAGTGTFTNLCTATSAAVCYRQNFNFVNPGITRRQFLALRFDYNIGKNHAIEDIFNKQPFRANADFLNSVDPRFPGLANAGTQQSDRFSNSLGFRSNFGPSIVNQFRWAHLWGTSRFDLVGGLDWFNSNMSGFSFVFPAAGGSSPTIRNASSSRTSPIQDFTDTLTVVHGNHTFTFGGEYKRIETISDSLALVVPSVTLGAATGDPASAMFVAANFPGATATDIANAQAVYDTITGRISAVGSNAVLGGNGQYTLNGSRHFEIRENTYGAFAQDSWRIRPNLTLSFGVRWQPQTGAQTMTTNYARLTNFNMLYDVSGPNNLFSPGTIGGVIPTVTGVTAGEKAFADDNNNFAPSVGVVWSPEFKGGFLKSIFGGAGTSVFRGGFSRSFIREGTLIVENGIGVNPGGSLSLTRNTTNANLTVGTLFRTPGNPNLVPPAFPATPSYPRALTSADAAVAYSPDFHSGYVDSFSFGYQRQIGKDTVIEFRYVGNRGKEMQSLSSLNEVNAIENGFGAEFRIAQQNLLANQQALRCINNVVPTASNQCQNNFAYFGPGSGTSPLPIMVSYLSAGNPNPGTAANAPGQTSYSSNFASTNYYPFLTPGNPNILGMASQIEGALRANGLAAGRPANFFNNCPTTIGFCFLFDNSETSQFDSATVELRRRLSNGLRVQASYTYGMAFTNAFAQANSFSTQGGNDQSNNRSTTLRNPDLDSSYAQIDLRHAFKADVTYDLPFGKGRSFLSSSNGIVNAIVGGWSISPTFRWQSGSPIILGDFQIVGMTAKDLQKAVKVRKTANGAYFLPQDIVDNTILAFNTTAVSPGTSSGLASTGYLGAAPTGRFLAPAGYANCQQSAPGRCGYRKFILYGPSFFKIDASVLKKIQIGEKRSFELSATTFDVLNRTNWHLGGWTGNVNALTLGGTTFGQLLTGTSYQDPNGSNDPGGRIFDFKLRLNF